MDLRTIFEEAHATSKEKGWWPDDTIENIQNGDVVLIGEKISLVHSELSEAIEELRCVVSTAYNGMRILHGKPGGFLVELADAAIRLGDLHEAIACIGYTPNKNRYESWLPCLQRSKDVSEITRSISHLHLQVSYLFQDMNNDIRRVATIDSPDTVNIVEGIRKLAARITGGESHFASALEAKMAYNRTRPHRHGGNLF